MCEQKLIALDTNVLLDHTRDPEVVADCLTTIRERIRRSQIIIPPTVIQELALLAEDGGRPESERRYAGAALRGLIGWGFMPVNCVPVGHGIVEETARKILVNQLLPETEFHDCLVLAESALLGAHMLVTNDAHLLDVDRERLQVLLDACDVSIPIIVTPRRIVSFYPR